MVQLKSKSKASWTCGSSPRELKKIHEKEINVAIYERDISPLKVEIQALMSQNIELHASGQIDDILETIAKNLNPEHCPLLFQDIRELLWLFKETSGASKIKLYLASIHADMCRRFHCDYNHLRMLCTYSGPGTLWLSDANVNRAVLNAGGDNQSIVINQQQINQVKTGDIIILKGAFYSKEGTKAAVHRSPAIESTGEKRLLIRLDILES